MAVALLAAGGAADALVLAVDELQLATSTAAAKAPTDAHNIVVGGARTDVPPARSPWHARLMPHGRRLLDRVVFDHMIASVVQAAAANARKPGTRPRAAQRHVLHVWHE